MAHRRTHITILASALLAAAPLARPARAGGGKPSPQAAPPGDKVLQAAKTSANDAAWAPAVPPKALSNQVGKGIGWLLKHQLQNGAWGQGEEAASMGGGMAGLADKGNVADTCAATLALMRAGSTPSSGPNARAVVRGLEFVMKEIEKSDKDSLSVTSVQGTRLQAKIGPYADTFLSSMLLAEANGKMPDPASERRLGAALDKVLHKIDKNQRADGSFEGQAWAPVLSQGLAAKGVNRSVQAGKKAPPALLRRSEGYARKQYDPGSKSFGAEGSAGVDLYSAAASAGAMSDSVNTRAMEEKELRDTIASTKDAKAKKAAEDKLLDNTQAREAQASAQGALVGRLADPKFASGFGSNGGEEFLSYMMISESLVTKGGKEWEQWDSKITTNLNRVQNPDGSWTGHHCITGRTFVTSTALLVLTADRAPVPLAAKMQRR
jgi:hypothetical protein